MVTVLPKYDTDRGINMASYVTYLEISTFMKTNSVLSINCGAAMVRKFAGSVIYVANWSILVN